MQLKTSCGKVEEMLCFRQSPLGHRLLAIGFALSLIWAGFILFVSVIAFDDIILLLEKYLIPDNQLARPYKAVAILVLTPPLMMSVVLLFEITRQTANPIYALSGYLLFLGIHFVFYESYGRGEDELLEWVTFGCAMLASILFLISGILGNWFAYLLCVVWLIFALEEISWGQRIFGVATPSFFEEHNYQKEMNIHNLFSGHYHLYLYVTFNSVVFLSLTWFARLQILSKLYQMQGVSHVLDVSNRFGLWFIPFCLIFLSYYWFHEFVEEQWGFFGVLLSTLLLACSPKTDQR